MSSSLQYKDVPAVNELKLIMINITIAVMFNTIFERKFILFFSLNKTKIKTKTTKIFKVLNHKGEKTKQDVLKTKKKKKDKKMQKCSKRRFLKNNSLKSRIYTYFYTRFLAIFLCFVIHSFFSFCPFSPHRKFSDIFWLLGIRIYHF